MDPKTEENERLNTLYAVTSFCNKLPTQTSHEEAKAVVMQLVKLILKQQATNSTNLLTSINLIQYLVVNHAKKLVDIVIYPDFNNVGNKVDIEPDSRFEDNEYDEDDLTITPSQNIIIETFMTHKFLHSEDEIPNCNVDYLITYCILRLFSKEELDNKCLEISNETLKNIISVYYKDFEFTHAYIYFTHLWACLKCTVVCILNETFDQEKLKPRDIYSAEIDKLTERFYSDIPLKNAVLKKFKFCLQPEITSIKNALAYLKRLAKIILYMMEQYEGLSNYCPRMLDFFIQLYQDRDDTEILEVLILMSNVDEFDSWVRPYSKTLQQNIFESVLFYASNSLRNQITLTEKEKENLIRQERIFSRALPLASRSSYSHGQTNFPSTDYLHNLVTTFYHSPPYDVAILISLCKYLCKYLSSFSDYHLIEKLGYNFKFPTIHSQLFNLMGLNQLIQYYWKEEVFDGEFYFDINPDILEHNNEDGYTDSELEAEEMGITKKFKISHNKETLISSTKPRKIGRGRFSVTENLDIIDEMIIDGSQRSNFEATVLGFLSLSFKACYQKITKEGSLDCSDFLAFSELFTTFGTSRFKDYAFILEKFLDLAMDAIKLWIEEISNDIESFCLKNVVSFIRDISILATINTKYTGENAIKFYKIFSAVWSYELETSNIDFNIENREVDSKMIEMRDEYIIELGNILGGYKIDLSKVKNDQTVYNSMLLETLKGFSCLKIDNFSFIKGYALLVSLAKPESDELNIEARRLSPIFIQTSPDKSKKKLFQGILEFLKPVPIDDVHNADEINYGSVRTFGMLFCAYSGLCENPSSVFDGDSNIMFCNLCDVVSSNNPHRNSKVKNTLSRKHLIDKELLKSFDWSVYLTYLDSRNASLIRELCMNSFYKIISHSPSIDLSKDIPVIINVCFNFLKDASHKVRHIANLILVKTVESENKAEIKEINYRIVFDKIEASFIDSSKFASRNILYSLIDELAFNAPEFILAKIIDLLIKLLMDANVIDAAMISNRIQNIERNKKTCLKEIFEPLWDYLVPTILIDLEKGRRAIKKLAHLMGFYVSDLAQIIHPFILPQIMLNCDTKSLDILCLVSAQGPNENTEVNLDSTEIARLRASICLANLDKILSILLLDLKNNDEPMSLFLQIVSEEDKPFSLAKAIKYCTDDLVENLVFELGSPDNIRKKEALDALSLVANALDESNGQNEAKSEVKDLLASKFMGFVSRFNIKLMNKTDNTINSIHLKMITGVDRVISIIDSRVDEYVTQIQAFLRTILRFRKHLTIALEVWKNYIFTLDERSLALVLNVAVVTLTEIYSKLSKKQKRIVIEILDDIFKRCSEDRSLNDLSFKKEDYLKCIGELSLLPENIEEFSKYNKKIKKLNSTKNIEELANLLISNTNHLNRVGRERALEKLYEFLCDNQDVISSWAIEVPTNTVIDNAIKQLMDIIHKHKEQDDEKTRYLVAKCFGAIGAIDPNCFEFKHTPKRKLMLFDPDSKDSCMKLAADLISSKLVELYHKSENYSVQISISYCLQELISLCSFDDPDMDSKEYNTDKTISPRLWFSFPQSTRETLQAFTRTRLSTWPSTAEKLVYPYYSPGLNFQTWVKSWTMDLIDYIEGEYSSQLFKPCYYSASSFIDISLFLLPYIILTLIVRNNINIKVGLSKEFNAILDIWEEADKFKDKKLDPQPIHLIINIIEGLSQIKMDMEIHLFEMYNGVYGDSLGMIKKSIEKDEAYSRLKNFIKDISPFKLAKAAINSNCYYEASKYLEQCIKIEEAKNNSNQKVLGDLNDDLHFVYSKINDEDSAKAIIDKLDTKTIEHKVRNYEAIKNWLAVETSYETLSRSNSTNLENQVGFTNCLQKLGYHGLTKNYIQEIIGKDPEREADSGLMRVLDECSWRVCSWGDPDKYLNDNTFDNVDKSLGQTLLSFKKNNGKGFDAVKLENTWMKMLPDFTITMDKSYTDGYESLMWAHMLYEVEDFNKSLGEAVNNEDQIDIIKNKAAKWDSRLKVVAPTYKAQEKILNLQRSLVTMYTSLPAPTTYNTQTVRASDKIKEALAINLVKSSKISRKGGYYQTSLISIHEFPESDNPLFIIEKAKWYRGQNDIHSAMRVLSNKLKTDNAEKEIDSKRSSRNGFVKDDKNISEIRLELIKYQIEANTESYVDILGELDKVIKSQPHWDKAHYISALYYLNQMEDELNGREENIKYDSLVLNLSNAAEHTLKCLMSSSKYIYQLLPRIITYWLDYCDTTSVKEYNKKYVDLVNKYLKGMAEKLKPYQFLPVLSQLISRVCVGCKDLYKILSAMIIKIFIAYPDQTLWGFFSSFLSEDKTRKALSIKIIDKSSQENSRVGEIYKEMLKFERFLLQLKKLSRSENLRPGAYKLQDVIPNFDTKYQFTSLLIPIESQLKFTLPNDMNTNYDNNLNFNPYNNNLITMNGFGSKLLVMPSMMRPIRFEIKGSDGNLYRFLCKPKDDLRKDARLMEFCNILNKMFYKNPESRMRHINIKTFTALPINNSVGLVEWVNDTECVKTIITSELNKIGIGGNDLYLTLKNVLDAKLATTRVKRIDKFENKAKPACPPVLINWFYRQFPNAEELYIARNKFAHSLAAMSIVGYIVGLGDRHGENLMVDTKSGQVMHVDFSCLFEQGLDLSVPELVPFRLTHNFEAILGPSGCEGAFRTTCEIVLQIMTDNKQILTSNLTTFLHDPLVDFNKIRQPADPSAINFIDAIRTERMRFLEEKSKKRPHPRLSEFAPVNSPIALWVLKRISYKLDGGYGTNIKLSRSGLVTRLIKEATDSENLFLMYIGWGSVY